MNCTWTHVDLGWRPGDIHSMTKEAVQVAELLNTKVSFDFNGVKVNITKHSTVTAVAEGALDAVRKGKNSFFGEGWR